MNLFLATYRLLTGDVRAVDVAINDANGAQLSGFDSTRPANAATTTLAATTTSAVLLPANAARRQYFIRNKSNQTAYIQMGAAASAASHVHVLPKGGYFDSVLNGYTGALEAVLASGTGDIDVTEVTT
jgi:hypothetical protein